MSYRFDASITGYDRRLRDILRQADAKDSSLPIVASAENDHQ